MGPRTVWLSKNLVPGAGVGAVYHDRDHQLGKELLRKLAVGQQSRQRQWGIRGAPGGDAEAVEDRRVVGLCELGESGPDPPQGAPQRLLVQVLHGGSVDDFPVVCGLSPGGHDERDLGLGHMAIAVSSAQIGAAGDSLRGDVDGAPIRCHRGNLGNDQQVALDLDDLGADLQRRSDVVPRHLHQRIAESAGIGQLHQAEALRLVHAEQDRSSIRVREGRQRLPHRCEEPSGGALRLDPRRFAAHPAQRGKGFPDAFNAHEPHLHT